MLIGIISSEFLTYFHSIDEDILRLIDEVDLKKELKEVGEAIVDTDKFPQYIREKSATAVSKFLVRFFLFIYLLQDCRLCANL